MTEYPIIGYLVIAAFFCIMTWWDNSKVHHTMGHPPSGIWVGITWPLMVLGILLWLIVTLVVELRRKR